ncbi:MAG: CDP-alcohol phosphatidyltransferase family protein [Sterolibacteriaceae bacterium]|nr:CDP-alcohol phosphatidyltransferase family protein [Sterolibacteriaceae bacterium]MBK9086676.1 CDP-alcohol phosphatidyltransferase family protein [Sterolibacteriaceae bacterium]
MPSIYDLKPRFQALLRPLVVRLHGAGVTANQVTLLACLVSVAIGAAICLAPERRSLFALIPVWLLLRMGLNAIDGMLAREFGQKSPLGAYLNELTDVFSDAALYLPFAFLPHFQPLWVCAAIGLAMASEYAGVLGPMVGASRRYDGPQGKSDRALVFGVLGLAIALGLPPAGWQGWIMPALCLLLALTVVNRVRAGLAESRALAA